MGTCFLCSIPWERQRMLTNPPKSVSCGQSCAQRDPEWVTNCQVLLTAWECLSQREKQAVLQMCITGQSCWDLDGHPVRGGLFIPRGVPLTSLSCLNLGLCLILSLWVRGDALKSSSCSLTFQLSSGASLKRAAWALQTFEGVK